MNDNHTGHAVLSPLFAQNLVQRLEQLNNVDQFTDASNLVLPFALFQLFQTDSLVASSNESPALLGGRSLPRYGRAASSATHPSGKKTPQRPLSD
jgi:hypothetical protein